MALLTSFDAINPRMPQVAWREAMLGKLPAKWSRRVSRRLEILDRQHRDWYHGNVYLREHVAEYADALFPLNMTYMATLSREPRNACRHGLSSGASVSFRR
ncbi:hypothetical protein [Burkholderia thailandensis]|uniref:hypothetical protein n=1 Tax=Burkholderia thailandensis TaxID=57975 RepID=UPI0004B80809|nr:hypothetical protein [Burkholderia thailandensis]MCZ2903659.1 hypothetical protein [Burkholderia thailandensis]